MPAVQPLKKPVDKKTFYDRVGSGTVTSHLVPSDMIKDSGGLFFRGDTRPSAEIFQNGFVPRENTGIVYRTMDQDVRPESAVCITDSLDVASLFPIMSASTTPEMAKSGAHNPPLQTTVYIVRAKKVFCTQDVQEKFAKHKIRDQGTPQKEQAQKNLYARERATDNIEAQDVVAAVQVLRHWEGNDYLAGGSYTIIGCQLNPNRSNDFKEITDKLMLHMKNRQLENKLGGTCRLAVAKERAAQGLPPNNEDVLEKPLWEQVISANNDEFVKPAWEQALDGEL